MLESLRGPKGSIVEGILPIVTLASVLCWLAFVQYRRYKHRPLSSNAAWSGGAFLLVIGMSASVVYPVYLGSRGKMSSAGCMSNVKWVQSGIMQYTEDWDERLPASNRWASLTNAYIHENENSSVWRCPQSASPYSYAFNQPLGGLATSALDDAANTVCLFESDAALWNAAGEKSDISRQERHGRDYFITGLLDGHVKFASKQYVLTDTRWQPLLLTPQKQP